MGALYEKMRAFLDLILVSSDAQRMLKAADLNDPQYGGFQDYQFTVGGEQFYLRFEGGSGGGRLSLHEGRTPRTDVLQVHETRMDEDAFVDLVEARMTPSEAFRRDRWIDVTGDSHPKRHILGLLTYLVRCGQEEVKKRKLQRFEHFA